MNEHQLAFGESTCDALLGMRSSPVSFGGSALFGIAALSRIALQRCKTARCAIELMGGLAEEKGFYGANSPAWVNGEMTPDKMGYAEGGEGERGERRHKERSDELSKNTILARVRGAKELVLRYLVLTIGYSKLTRRFAPRLAPQLLP